MPSALKDLVNIGAVQLPLGAEALQEMLSGELHSFAISLGLLVAEQLLEEEVTRL